MLAQTFDKFSRKVTKVTGSVWAFIFAILLVVIWALAGPFYKWSELHSLFINTTTTIITFLMVFVIQQTANRDMAALQIKLNELIKAIEKADNNKIGIEDLTEDEIIKLKQ